MSAESTAPVAVAPTGDARPPARTRLEAALVEHGLVSPTVLASLAGRVAGARRPLVEVLLEQKILSEDDLLVAVAKASRLEPAKAEDLRPEASVQGLVPAAIAQRLGILPLRLDADDALVVATADPFALDAFDEVRARTGRRVRVLLARPSAVRAGLQAARGTEETFDALVRTPRASTPTLEFDAPPAPAPVEAPTPAALGVDIEGDENPVVRFVNLLLADALQQGASDVHIEPERDVVRIRFRVDGELHEVRTLPAGVRGALAARLLAVAGLEHGDPRRPQEGRTGVRLDGARFDLRVSTLPSLYGDRIVLRILDGHAPSLSLDGTGLAPAEVAAWRELLHRPTGMLLVTGPSDSGRTSTLYASLLEVRSPTASLVAIEDRAALPFAGIAQVAVRADAGMTSAATLRSVLRQDPDVVLLGELRDRETAEVALQASLCGHLVLARLPANDPLGAVAWLLDLGVDRDLVATAVVGILAQRLVRTVCDACAAEHRWPQDVLALLGAHAATEGRATRHGAGCGRCRGTGLRGRTVIGELVRMTPALQKLIRQRAPADVLRAQAARDGTRSLAEAGLARVLEGVTVPQEVFAVAGGVRTEAASPAAASGATTAPPTPVDAAPAMKPCPACGKRLEAAWRACPHCGRAVGRRPAGTSVLVCDDDPVQRRIVAATLRQRFDRVLEAADGVECLDVVAREEPDLLVVDHSMPKLSGVGVIRTLRAQVRTASMPILMLTAAEGPAIEEIAMETGADDYLTKPVTAERLQSRVAALLAVKPTTPPTANGAPRPALTPSR